jgi:tRNA-2-methylthio-N6-dimethylallyladenosine synthase
MNVRDSEVICGLLTANDYRLTAKLEEADIIIFNTCSVRQHAEDKVWSEIGRFKGQSPKNSAQSDLTGTVFKGKETLGTVPLGKQSRDLTGTVFKGKETLGTVPLGKQSRDLTGTVPIIGVVGCMAQAHKEKIFDRAPNVDFVVGPSDIHKIPEIVFRLLKKEGQSPKNGDSPFFELKIWETDGDIRPEEIYHTGFYQDKNHAYVVISEGCSNYCSYCVVPYVRGQLRNRNCKDILKEIEEAVDKGITSITLLGQNVNAYRDGEVGLVELVELVELVDGLKEFSFITSHPKDTSEGLFKAMRDLGKLKKYLHLPVQSGSDRILKLMNRGYTRDYYLDLIKNFRKIVKDGILTTDIIVGFPTETEEDFQATYNLVKDVEFNAAYIFKYSTRPHTEAEKLTDDVPKEKKERRHKLILDLQKVISNKKKCQKK